MGGRAVICRTKGAELTPGLLLLPLAATNTERHSPLHSVSLSHSFTYYLPVQPCASSLPWPIFIARHWHTVTILLQATFCRNNQTHFTSCTHMTRRLTLLLLLFGRFLLCLDWLRTLDSQSAFQSAFPANSTCNVAAAYWMLRHWRSSGLFSEVRITTRLWKANYGLGVRCLYLSANGLT